MGEEFLYRSAASAGALYPSEIYIATHCVKDLDDGLYHFSIADHGMHQLRKGDLSAHIIKAAKPAMANAPIAVFFLSAIFFRSAWKYRERAYRYNLLDTGHLLENLILALKSLALSFTSHYDFDDTKINRLLGLDETREASLVVLSVPGSHDSPEKVEYEIEELSHEIKKASKTAEKETSYPIMQEMHRAGAPVLSPSEPELEMIHTLGVVPDKWERVDPSETWPESADYAGSVFNRRSRRNYVRKPIPRDCLTALLDCLCPPDLDTASAIHDDHYRTVCTGLLIGRAEGYESGVYLLDTSTAKVGKIAPGDFTDRAARVCLDQGWLANASVLFLFMTNLHVLDRQWGPRGYRYAMMTAGRMGERLYLAATSMELGCCGVGAFYDDEAVELLGINPESRLLYLVAIGPIKSAVTV
jgi:SagB-type dehydrogenase family enzyme